MDVEECKCGNCGTCFEAIGQDSEITCPDCPIHGKGLY